MYMHSSTDVFKVTLITDSISIVDQLHADRTPQMVDNIHLFATAAEDCKCWFSKKNKTKKTLVTNSREGSLKRAVRLHQTKLGI